MPAKRKRPGRPVVEKITDAQRQSLQAIREFTIRHAYPPTMAELGRALKISGASAYQLVLQLERKGYVTRLPKQPRSLRIVRDIDHQPTMLVSVPIQGTVKAGTKVLAEENRIGEVMVESNLVGKAPCFALKVIGDSMIDARIHDGDLVIVRQQQVAESGEIVVALLDNETNVKRLFFQDGRVELRSENKRYAPLVVSPDADFRILGKVIAVRQL